MMDGARHFSIITTQRKAITAASQRQPTGYAPEENALSMTVRMGDFTNVPGGFPIRSRAKSSARLRPAAQIEQDVWSPRRWRARRRPPVLILACPLPRTPLVHAATYARIELRRAKNVGDSSLKIARLQCSLRRHIPCLRHAMNSRMLYWPSCIAAGVRPKVTA
jgi:hypothetical protein